MAEIVHAFTDAVLRHLIVGSVAAIVLVPLALAILKVGRVRTPVYRHVVWLTCLVGIVGLPLIWLHGPKLSLAILPANVEINASPAAGPDVEEPGPAPVDSPKAAVRPSRQDRTAYWQVAVAAAWLAGFSIMLTRLFVGWTRLRRICRAATPLPASDYPVRASGGRLSLRLTSQLEGPVCFGMWRPTVLLPQEMIDAGNRDSLRMVLAHESAHIQRRDCWVNLFQRIVEAVYFFHALVWLASRQLTQEREEICDNHVLAAGVSPDDYTILLSNLGAQAVNAGYLQTVALFEGQLLSRVRSLLDPSRSRQTRLPLRVAAICTVAVVSGFLVVGCIRLAAQPADRTGGLSPERQLSSSDVAERKSAQSLPSNAADSEKPEPPRYAARTFNSKAEFTVFFRKTSGTTTRTIGRTPSATPLEIPACNLWWVKPLAPVKDWELLVREISQNKIPGLALDSAIDSDLKHLANLTGLQDLDLARTQITDAGLTHLKGLKGLQSLRLSRTRITDAGLQHLKDLTGLQWLLLPGTQVTDAGLADLEGLTALEGLDLSSTQITDAGLEHLKGLTGLQTLYLSDTKITDAGLEHLKGVTQWEWLDLSDTQVTGEGLAHLKGTAGLRFLNLRSTQVTDAGLTKVKDLTGLRVFWVSDTKITDAGLANLNGLSRMQHLDLSGTQTTDEGLVHLARMTELLRLDLSNTQIKGPGLEHIKGATRLYELKLDNTQVGDVGLEHLKGLTALRSLYLRTTHVTDAGLAHLSGLVGLRSLILSGTQITDAGVEHLNGLTQLQVLMLSNPKVTDLGLTHLKGLAALEALNLSKTHVTDAGLGNLRNLKELGWLHLSQIPITDAGLVHLKDLAKLEDLNLSSTQITDAGLAYLEGLLGLRKLGLSSTKVTEAGVQELTRRLPGLTVTREQAKERQ